MAHRGRMARVAWGVLLVLGLLPLASRSGAAEERRTVTPPSRTFHLLVFLVDFSDSRMTEVSPNHRPWQSREFLNALIFGTPEPLTDASGRRLVTSSVAQYVAKQMPGVRLAGRIHEYTPEQDPDRDGWYRYDLDPGEGPHVLGGGLQADEVWPGLHRRIGYDRMGSRFLRPDGRPYDAIFMIHGDAGGACQGNVIGTTGLWNTGRSPDLEVRYDFFGTLCHEIVTHLVGGLNDFYGHVWEQHTCWSLFSAGNDLHQFPAPINGWIRNMLNLGRIEIRLEKGESGTVRLRDRASTPSDPPEIVVLDNSTVGPGDRLIAEYRPQSVASDAYDGLFFGRPRGNRSGLLVTDFDPLCREYYFSRDNLRRARPSAFAHALEDTEINPYAMGPVAEIKRKDGMITRDGQDDVFADRDLFLGSYPGNGPLQPLRSSANREGDVLWEFRDLVRDPTGFSFQAEFQGRALSAEATDLRAHWRSAAGEVSIASDEALHPEGHVYAQSLFRAVGGRTYRDVLWVDTNRDPSGTPGHWVEGTFPHRVAPTGERLAGNLIPPFGDLRFSGLRVVLTVDAPPAPAVVVLDTTDAAPPFCVDLSRWAGRLVGLVLRVETPRRMPIGVSAWAFRKADRVLRDYVDSARDARATLPDPVLAPQGPGGIGAVSTVDRIRLEDGVLYDRALLMRPPPSGGVTRFVLPTVHVPDSGGILRGSVGYPLNAVDDGSGHASSDGATVRLLIDDGLHRFTIRDWTPPILGENPVHVAPSLPGTLTLRSPWTWGTNFCSAGELNPPTGWSYTWDGDIVRAGDVDGDGKDDLVILVGGPRPRVGVALSQGTRFAEPRVWFDSFPVGERYPLLADVDGDGKKDLVAFTASGEATWVRSDGSSFGREERVLGHGLAGRDDVPALADVNGDGFDDVVLFARQASPGRGRGSVHVALNDRTGRVLEPHSWFGGEFAAGDRVPLVGDVDGDGRADIVCVHLGQGVVRVARSTGTNFSGATVWSRDGPRRSPLAPDRDSEESVFGRVYRRVPGPGHIDGPVPMLATRPREPAVLIWFCRSQVSSDEATRIGDVYAALAGPYGFGATTLLSGDFCTWEDWWPLVADFSGDGAFDVAALEPRRPGMIDWYFENDPTGGPALRYPGDLYVSPKAAAMPMIGRLPPRLNRIELDLFPWRGKDVTLEVTLDSGPSAEHDEICWPELKVYGKTVVPAVIEDAGVRFDDAAPVPTSSGATTAGVTPTPGRARIEGSLDIDHVVPHGRVEWGLRMRRPGTDEAYETPLRSIDAAKPGRYRVAATLVGFAPGESWEVEVFLASPREVGGGMQTFTALAPPPPEAGATTLAPVVVAGGSVDLHGGGFLPPGETGSGFFVLERSRRPDEEGGQFPRVATRSRPLAGSTSPFAVDEAVAATDLPPGHGVAYAVRFVLVRADGSRVYGKQVSFANPWAKVPSPRPESIGTLVDAKVVEALPRPGGTVLLRGSVRGTLRPIEWWYVVRDEKEQLAAPETHHREDGPGAEVSAEVEVKGLYPDAKYVAVLIAESGGRRVESAPFSIVVPREGPSVPVPGSVLLVIKEATDLTADAATLVGWARVPSDDPVTFRVRSGSGAVVTEVKVGLTGGGGTEGIAVKERVTGLEPERKYVATLVWLGPQGEQSSEPYVFATPAGGKPSVDTPPKPPDVDAPPLLFVSGVKDATPSGATVSGTAERAAGADLLFRVATMDGKSVVETPAVLLGEKSGALLLAANVAGLSPNTGYRATLVARRAGGEWSSEAYGFSTTVGGPPKVPPGPGPVARATLAVTGIAEASGRSVTLLGLASEPKGTPIAFHLRPRDGKVEMEQPAEVIGSDARGLIVRATFKGLLPGTAYVATLIASDLTAARTSPAYDFTTPAK